MGGSIPTHVGGVVQGDRPENTSSRSVWHGEKKSESYGMRLGKFRVHVKEKEEASNYRGKKGFYLDRKEGSGIAVRRPGNASEFLWQKRGSYQRFYFSLAKRGWKVEGRSFGFTSGTFGGACLPGRLCIFLFLFSLVLP